MNADLVIVGGGPAGLAAAIHGAQRGLSSVVIEQRPLPLDKACGEGIMPAGVAALQRMGVDVPLWGRAPFIGIRYVDGATVAEGRFAGGPGWGVRRTALVEGMVSRARALGVELLYGCHVEGWQRSAGGVSVATARGSMTGRLLVGADGLHSRIRRAAGLERPWRGRRRFGMRRHFTLPPWSPFVEVYWVDNAEAYITPAGPDRVGVALLWDGRGGSFDDLLARFPAVRERLGDAPAETEVRGAGPFRQGVRRRYADRVALVGDSAGYLDALTGEGLTLAFHSAEALADTLARGAHLAAYERAYRRLSRIYYHLTALVLALGNRPSPRHLMVSVLARHPNLFSHVLTVNGGTQPLPWSKPYTACGPT